MYSVHDERLINVYWASKRLGLAPRTIRQLARRGRLPAVRVGSKLWMFRSLDVDLFKEGPGSLIKPRRRLCTGGHHAGTF